MDLNLGIQYNLFIYLSNQPPLYHKILHFDTQGIFGIPAILELKWEEEDYSTNPKWLLCVRHHGGS